MSAFAGGSGLIKEGRRKSSLTRLFVRNPIAISAQKNAMLIARTAASRVEFFILVLFAPGEERSSMGNRTEAQQARRQIMVLIIQGRDCNEVMEMRMQVSHIVPAVREVICFSGFGQGSRGLSGRSQWKEIVNTSELSSHYERS
jgi:hypothetical protein